MIEKSSSYGLEDGPVDTEIALRKNSSCCFEGPYTSLYLVQVLFPFR